MDGPDVLNYIIGLYNSVVLHLHPNNDSSALRDYLAFCTRKHKNCECVHELASDLQDIYDCLQDGGFVLGEKTLTIQLVAAVLDGTYGSTTDAIQSFANKIAFKEIQLSKLTYKFFPSMSGY